MRTRRGSGSSRKRSPPTKAAESTSVSQIEQAIEILRRGGVVAFPTETVYGLGADATNAAAVRRIFEIKGRPATNPLICHVADETVARRYAREWPLAASQLAKAFWPGPLTLVVPKTDDIVPEATAGRETVGLRAPDHPLTLELLRALDRPLAGPSANRSTHVSPTTAQHVRDELGDAVDLILDGGPCAVGIESTVLDLSTDTPTILRPGGVSRAQIETVIGPVRMPRGEITSVTLAAKSPGQHERHYAPRTPAYRFESAHRPDTQRHAGLVLIGSSSTLCRSSRTSTEMPNAPDAYAHELYAVLHEMDALGLDAIFIELPPDAPEWAAVRDRLMRAARPIEQA
jgi:L-threonylcarbamoyladenylate synthase